jgi:hypothetical protein
MTKNKSTGTAEPVRSRPHIEGYGIPESEEGMLPWSHVTGRMGKPRNYWIASVSLSGRPHTVPSWGVWVDNVFYFGGGPKTRHLRNIMANPAIVVHLESGDEVVIIEGDAEEITDPDLQKRIDEAYVQKYKMPHGTPVFALRPRKAFGWTEYPTTVTRWTFG